MKLKLFVGSMVLNYTINNVYGFHNTPLVAAVSGIVKEFLMFLMLTDD